MIAADLIGRRVYAARGTPVLSLWAKRHEKRGESAFWYFDNEYNDATMGSIRKVAAQGTNGKSIKLLLIDDHMGTGSTAVQAVTYIRPKFLPVTS